MKKKLFFRVIIQQLNLKKMSSTLNFIEPQQSQINKQWHENINNEMRKHLVKKIIQTIFPTYDHNIYSDPRLSNLVKYAIKTECEMYEQAQDQEEYFHLLAERIYKIQNTYSVIALVNKLNRLPEDIILKGFNTRPHFFFCSIQSIGSYNITYEFPQTLN